MEIIVEGSAKDLFAPNEIIINFNFIEKGQNYDEILKEGSDKITQFKNNVLFHNGFTENDFKTKQFIIKEDKEYNSITHKYDFIGYSFNQTMILKFEYNNDKLINIINDITKLNSTLMCQIYFGINDKNECYKRLLTKAYNDALEKANTLALASNKKIINCIKIECKTTSDDYIINSNIEPLSLTRYESYNNSNSIIPDGIQISETISSVWLAE